MDADILGAAAGKGCRVLVGESGRGGAAPPHHIFTFSKKKLVSLVKMKRSYFISSQADKQILYLAYNLEIQSSNYLLLVPIFQQSEVSKSNAVISSPIHGSVPSSKYAAFVQL
jgi:hypothetical protein